MKERSAKTDLQNHGDLAILLNARYSQSEAPIFSFNSRSGIQIDL